MIWCAIFLRSRSDLVRVESGIFLRIKNTSRVLTGSRAKVMGAVFADAGLLVVLTSFAKVFHGALGMFREGSCGDHGQLF